MTAALTYVGASVAVLLLLTLLYVIEDAKGRRVLLVRARSGFDSLLIKFLQVLGRIRSFFTHGIIRIMLHYGAHNVLKRILLGLRSMEKRVENLVRHNRRVAKDIHAAKTRNHLDEIAEHKEEVALSDIQKKERRSR